MLYNGAGFIVKLAGNIKLMPGITSNLAFRHVDAVIETRKGRGLL